MEECDFLIVGAGFAGCVLAERLANVLGKKVIIIDKRGHLGGNCYDFVDDDILVQKYGPHIFHTSNSVVWEYISQFSKFNNYKHKVIAFYKGKYYPIPINLETVNSFYNLHFNSEDELRSFLDKKRLKIKSISNSRDVVLSKFGNDLYEAFVKKYTKKQWDKYPEELDKQVLERLPIKYDSDPYYFADKYQGMPIGGFTKIFEKMVNHEKIDLRLNTDFFMIKDKIKYKKLIFSGRIDKFFGYKFGKLKFRGIELDIKKLNKKSFQSNSVVNYTDDDVKFSRITEFKKFYENNSDKTIICYESFSWGGVSGYPVMDIENSSLLKRYIEEAKKLETIYFIGRLGKYKYINMDQVIAESLELFDKLKKED